jgi:subtilisin family serine protease
VSFSPRAGLKRPVTLAVASAAAAALAFAMPGSAGAAPTPAEQPALYLVQTAGSSIATYEGGVQGIPKTKAEPGQKLNRRAWNYQSYRRLLTDQHKKVQQAAGVANKAIVDYSVAFNGFAAKLTTAEVQKLKSTPGVVNVFKNKIHTTQTVSTPTFLGLDGPGGVWQKQFGGDPHAGEGVIVGVLDTGYWPENPAFGPLPEPRPDQAVIDEKWGTGDEAAAKCQVGDDHQTWCNNKVIGARWFNQAGLADRNPDEFHSPRDFNGHGSHTASTAAGNHGVTASINGAEVGKISGMAPAARLAIYKVLYQRADGTSAGGSSIDIVAAIDQAVADGVDVLSYSIGDDDDSIGPVELAFFNAAAANVFVSAAAGNNGAAGASTVDNAAPWVTTVAASSHDRGSNKTVTLGNGAKYTGAGVGTAALPATALVDSAKSVASGADPTAAELCTPGTLDTNKVTGKVVLCKRGVVARTDKSKAVKDAGGVGMILYNASAAQTIDADFHFVPSIHVGPTEGTAIKAYIGANANGTAALSAAVQVKKQAPQMAEFSSWGPSKSSSGNLLKPDITAPGVDVLAATAPPGNDGHDFASLQGTSMATPHISGIAALIKSKHQDWSPTAIKSAMMTTAYQVDNTGKPIQRSGANATPLDFGAGHVSPAPAFDPGLVYESDPIDWFRYTCGINVHLPVGADGEDVCGITGAIDPSDLNYPSISVGGLAGEQTVTRTVKNVSDRSSTYVAKVQAPAGFSISVNPQTITVAPGKTATYKVTIKRTNGEFGKWAFGAVSLLDLRGHTVRSPIAVRPVVVAAPANLAQKGASGSVDLSLKVGYDGQLLTKAHGLTASTVTTKTLVGATGSFSPDAPAEGPAVAKVRVTVPAGTALGRVATYGTDYGTGSDLDVYVYDTTGLLVGQSAGGTSDEQVDLPGPGDYDVYVAQFALPTGATQQDVKLNTFAVPASAAGNLTLTPASQRAISGKQATVKASWTGLTPGQHYLGEVVYSDGTAVRGATVISVDA